ncbi:hypothetical protein VPH35_082570 [Triticum aestivum]
MRHAWLISEISTIKGGSNVVMVRPPLVVRHLVRSPHLVGHVSLGHLLPTIHPRDHDRLSREPQRSFYSTSHTSNPPVYKGKNQKRNNPTHACTFPMQSRTAARPGKINAPVCTHPYMHDLLGLLLIS